MLTKIKGVLVALPVLGGAYVSQAVAAVPADVTTALTDMKADAITIATVFLVATIALTAFVFMKRGAH